MDPKVTRIRHLLAQAGLSVKSVARRHQVPERRVRDAMRRPDALGETAIAKALGTHPGQLWPERYTDDGSRLKPQPPELYPGSGSAQRLSGPDV